IGEVQRSLTFVLVGCALEQRGQSGAPACAEWLRWQQAGRDAALLACFAPPCSIAQPGGQRCPSRHCQEEAVTVDIKTKATHSSQATPLRLGSECRCMIFVISAFPAEWFPNKLSNRSERSCTCSSLPRIAF